ncbi:hypothetical protein KR067_001287, partial [Drosophila pandora]
NVVCSLKLCNKPISASQASIYCWLCESVSHAKCAGLTASVSDAISRRVGLHYCCSGCRAVQDEMRSFMRLTKSGFKDLIVGFRKINDQLSALDVQFNSLQLLNESPKRKKSATREVAAPVIAEQLDPPAIMQPLISLATPRAGTVNEKLAPEFTVAEQNLSALSSMASLQVIPRNTLELTPIASTRNGNPPPGPPERTDAAVLPTVAPKPLQVIPPVRQIFVSRLAPDTSEIDISAYIKAKTKAVIRVEDIRKFKYSYSRRMSSFMIRVPVPMFVTICSPGFWPEDIFVQE